MYTSPPDSGPFIHVTIRTFEPNRAGTIPIGLYLPPLALEHLRSYRLARPVLPGPFPVSDLVDGVLQVYDQVRDRWTAEQVRESPQEAMERVAREAMGKIAHAMAHPEPLSMSFRKPYPVLTPELARVSMAFGAWFGVVELQPHLCRGLFHTAEDAQKFALDGWRVFILDSYLKDPENYRGYAVNKGTPPAPPAQPTVEERIEYHWNTPAGRVRLYFCKPGDEHIPIVRFERINLQSPREYFPDEAFPTAMSETSAAEIVAAWASDPARGALELELARGYLSRWPEGPQIPAVKPED